MKKKKDFLDNSYRSAPRIGGATHDPAATRRLDIGNDTVSVIHSGESDPMPSREAQDAFDDRPEALMHSMPGLVQGGRNNPTDGGSMPKEDDENDFESQQHLAEDAGIEIDEEEEGQEEVA